MKRKCHSLQTAVLPFVSLSRFSVCVHPSVSCPLSICLCLSVSVFLFLSIWFCLCASVYLFLCICFCVSVSVYLFLSICSCPCLVSVSCPVSVSVSFLSPFATFWPFSLLLPGLCRSVPKFRESFTLCRPTPLIIRIFSHCLGALFCSGGFALGLPLTLGSSTQGKKLRRQQSRVSRCEEVPEGLPSVFDDRQDVRTVRFGTIHTPPEFPRNLKMHDSP